MQHNSLCGWAAKREREISAFEFASYSVLNGGLDLPAGCMIMKLAFDLLHNYIFCISKWRCQHVCYPDTLVNLTLYSGGQRFI